jgi:NADH/F420H2 dehydrogenase subunit C
METTRVKDDLEQRFEGVSLAAIGEALLVPPEHLTEVAQVLRDEERYRFDYLSCLLAADYPEEGVVEVVYILYSVEKRHGPLVLKVRVDRDPAKCRVPSVTPLWRGAEFQEREAYDLYGVTFEGHPDLRRILLWDGFEGHPMRKDFVHEDPDTEESAEEVMQERE